MIEEKTATISSGGLLPLVISIGSGLLAVLLLMLGVDESATLVVLGVLLGLTSLFGFAGLFKVEPNQGWVLTLFGAYAGTVREQGLWWVLPFYGRRMVSLRVRNFETGRLKVNEQDGNPIEIAAVVVWRVVDTAEAVFEVEDFENYVRIQSEAALRNLATGFPYDSHEGELEISLRSHTDEIARRLRNEIQDRLNRAGIEVIEARISHLAYSPEIASAMLRRQQASAIIAARHKIVEGAVSMVEMALQRLSEQSIVELDEERKAQMVSNLMVVLCGDRDAQPMINTGTLQ